MSQNRMSWVVATITTLIAMMLASLAGIPAAQAATPQTPGCVQLAVDPAYPDIPPPWQCDRSGIEQDTYYVTAHVRPGYNGSPVQWRSGEAYLTEDREVSSRGAASIPVAAWVFDEATRTWVTGPSWSLSYNLTVTATEASDSFRFEIGPCNNSTNQVQVTPYFNNTDDASDLTVKRAYLVLKFSFGDNLVFGLPQFAENIPDGQSGVVGTYSLYPDAYEVFLAYTQNGTKVRTDTLVVPKCGTMAPPGTGTGTPDLDKPTVRISQLRGHKMKVAMSNLKVDRSTKFRLKIDKPGVGGKVVKTYTVKPGGKMSRTFRRPVGTTFVVKAMVPVEVAARTYKMRWRVIGRRTMLR